jgi:hypothetical protein
MAADSVSPFATRSRFTSRVTSAEQRVDDLPGRRPRRNLPVPRAVRREGSRVPRKVAPRVRWAITSQPSRPCHSARATRLRTILAVVRESARSGQSPTARLRARHRRSSLSSVPPGAPGTNRTSYSPVQKMLEPLLAYVVRQRLCAASLLCARARDQPRARCVSAGKRVHPTGQKSNKCPQVEGHVLCLSARHAKLRRDGFRKYSGH